MHLLSLLTKTDVHCMELSTNHLLNHAWNFSSIDGKYSASTFQLTGKAEPLKIRGKNDLQKCRKIEL